MMISELTPDGTAEPCSRDQILRREPGQGKSDILLFPPSYCSADPWSGMGNRIRLIPNFLYVMTIQACMAKWIAAEEAGAGLRYAVVCPNVTGRT